MSNELLKQFQAMSRDVPDSKFTLPGSGEDIYFVPFTTKDQKALLKSMEKEDFDLIQEAFDNVLKKCVTNANFDPKNLYPKDRESLLIALRKESVNDQFTHYWKCENEVSKVNENGEEIKDENGEKVKETCGGENKKVISLNELEMKSLQKMDFNKEVALEDKSNCFLLLDMTKRKDELAVMKYTKKNSGGIKGLSRTELLYATLASFISGLRIGDQETKDLTLEDRITIIDGLTLKDRRKIEDYITSLESHGYDLTIKECKCSKCGHEDEQKLEWIYFFAV
jgi:hypothetical protein